MFKLGCDVKDNVKAIRSLVGGWSFFLRNDIVVGITEESNVQRENGMSNSQLLYLHENGVPSHNIPARPVLKPALAQPHVRDKIKKLLKDAAVQSMILGNKQACEQNFHKAGMIGRDACKKWITDGTHLAPNAPATIDRKGSSIPLIDKASMLNSITYAVRKK